MKEKNAAEERMAGVQAKLDEMQANFDAAMAQKQALEDDATSTQKKMDSANALLQALAGLIPNLSISVKREFRGGKSMDRTLQRVRFSNSEIDGRLCYCFRFCFLSRSFQ